MHFAVLPSEEKPPGIMYVLSLNHGSFTALRRRIIICGTRGLFIEFLVIWFPG